MECISVRLHCVGVGDSVEKDYAIQSVFCDTARAISLALNPWPSARHRCHHTEQEQEHEHLHEAFLAT